MTFSAFSETLKSITTTKLNELSKKRAIFETHKSSLLVATQVESDQQKKVRLLVDGVKRSFAIKSIPKKRGRNYSNPIISSNGSDQGLVVLLKNIERFFEQARYDPTISTKLLLDWEQSLMKKLNIQSLKYQYATLYGELVNEWLTAEQSTKDTSSMDLDGFEVIDKAGKQEARNEWEKVVFEPFETDQVAINTYLGSLFGNSGKNTQALKALGALRKAVGAFEIGVSATGQFNDQVLRWTISGLLSSGLLSEEKCAVLKDFLASPIILAEVADVLNMRIASIETWRWEQDYVPVEQRRHLNGNYHIYIDEDLLEAIFLQYVGVKWSVFFKEAFTNFSNYEGAWNSIRKPVSSKGKDRREYFLGSQKLNPSVQSKRQGLYKSIFFMSQLPDSPYEESGAVEGEEEVNYDSGPRKRTKQTGASSSLQQQHILRAQQMQMQMQQQAAPRYAMAAQQAPPTLHRPMTTNAPLHPGNPFGASPNIQYDSAFDQDDDTPKPKSSMETKQFLLHLLSTEILLNTRLYGDFTCTRSEFESWSPTLPHSTIRSVLSFFGLSGRWLGFFNTFLEAPLKFVEDGMTAETRIRKRGVPGAHSLSAMCGETVLFVLDYAVNQNTEGAQLYRMHDDFWIWSSSHATVVKGWEAITTFADTMGVTLNERKTGTVRIQRGQKTTNDVHPKLPTGDIRWGFMWLNPASGRFVIDQDMVDKHINELQHQLQDKKSIFSWIQAWNTYAGTFFKSNFGKPANCFGREHVDMMLNTMKRIQKCIFQDSNVVEYLKHTIEARFGVTDIPDGYLYFPTSLGGLELQNPFIGTIQVHNAVCENPKTLLDDFFEDENEAYRRAKRAFDNGQVHRYYSPGGGGFKPDDTRFMSFDEFCRYREELSADWEGNLLSVYNELLKKPEMESVDIAGSELRNLDVFRENGELDDGYLRWVGLLHGSEILEKFGGLNVVDEGLLPIGMVNLFRSGRIRWEN